MPNFAQIVGNDEVYKVVRRGANNTRIESQNTGEQSLVPTQELVFFEIDEEAEEGIIVPVTPLREFYRWLAPRTTFGLSYQFLHESLADKFLNHLDELLDLFLRSVNAFNAFSNVDQPFHPPRRQVNQEPKRNTAKLQWRLEGPQQDHELRITNAEGNLVDRYLYLDREVSPGRIQGVPLAAENLSGKGGIDLLLSRCVGGQSVIPVVAEIKVKDDKTPFFALIQSLTYAAELLSVQQQQRIQQNYADELHQATLRKPPQVELLLLFVGLPDDLVPVLGVTEEIIAKLLINRSFAALVPRIVVAVNPAMPQPGEVFQISENHRRVYS